MILRAAILANAVREQASPIEGDQGRFQSAPDLFCHGLPPFLYLGFNLQMRIFMKKTICSTLLLISAIFILGRAVDAEEGEIDSWDGPFFFIQMADPQFGYYAAGEAKIKRAAMKRRGAPLAVRGKSLVNPFVRNRLSTALRLKSTHGHGKKETQVEADQHVGADSTSPQECIPPFLPAIESGARRSRV